MNLNSVNTNIGAMTALQSLNRTNDALAAVQKRVSTGFRVADAKDDGGAFAVAQSVRGDVAGLTAANEQLGGLKGIVDVTLTSLGLAGLSSGGSGGGGLELPSTPAASAPGTRQERTLPLASAVQRSFS